MNRSEVFLNVPFDNDYRSLFVALVTGVLAHGGKPRCVLELPASRDRLTRLKQLVKQCPVSFHDLSRVKATHTNSHGFVPRFNMPFELGLSVMAGGRFFVLEEKSHRLQVSLSDLNGYDPLIHNGKPEVLLSRLCDALSSPKHRPTVRQLVDVFRRIQRGVKYRARTHGTDIFTRSAFLDLISVSGTECHNAGLL
jgi:hypothetical protein